MTGEEILGKLRQIMKRSTEKTVNWDTVTGETAIASLGFDSLSMLDLIYDIQQEFGLEFDAEALTKVRCVQDLVSFLQERGA
jgi:acyl carrier protein